MTKRSFVDHFQVFVLFADETNFRIEKGLGVPMLGE